MIIPIRAPENSESTEKVEWVMLELNGELLTPLEESGRTSSATASLAADDISGRVELGSVKFDANGSPTLIVGNHELKGTAIALKEPFAVLKKIKRDNITNAAAEASETKLMSHSGVELEVVGVVKTKLMFAKYPKSIMR